MQQLLINLIKFYQKTLSLAIGGACRFYPTCSSYSIEAIEKHGSLKGSWMMVQRICRCHPLNPGGIDYVPTSIASNQKTVVKEPCQNKH